MESELHFLGAGAVTGVAGDRAPSGKRSRQSHLRPLLSLAAGRAN